MAERTARLGFMHYRDADGRIRDAAAGEKIHVHPDDVERFDSLNHLLGKKEDEDVVEEPEAAEPEKAATPRRGRPKKAAE